MLMVTCFWKIHVLGDMLCFQLSGYDVTLVVRGGLVLMQFPLGGSCNCILKIMKDAKQFHSKEIIRLC